MQRSVCGESKNFQVEYPYESELVLNSMTGQGQALGCLGNVTIEVETRSINNRFLKVTSKVSSLLRNFENSVEPIVRDCIRRGTIQVTISVRGLSRSGANRLNSSALENYWIQACEVANRLGAPVPGLESLMQLPGVIEDGESEEEDPKVTQLATETLRKSLLLMNHMRLQEGQAMASEILTSLEKIEAYSVSVAARAPLVVAEYQSRLESRLKQALVGLDIELDHGIILREAQTFADRSDIREELVRLASHLQLFRKAMDDSESQGRKLDFLVQELNREINTIGSKANDALITEQVIEMKTTLEQIRELIQNIE